MQSNQNQMLKKTIHFYNQHDIYVFKVQFKDVHKSIIHLIKMLNVLMLMSSVSVIFIKLLLKVFIFTFVLFQRTLVVKSNFASRNALVLYCLGWLAHTDSKIKITFDSRFCRGFYSVPHNLSILPSPTILFPPRNYFWFCFEN